MLLVVVFCLEVGGALLAYSHQDGVRGYIEDSMTDAVYKHYSRKAAFTEIFDAVQTKVKGREAVFRSCFFRISGLSCVRKIAKVKLQ